MRLLRYVAWKAVTAFAGSLAVVVVIFLAVEFAENAGLFSGPGWVPAALQVLAYRAAAFAYQTAPAAMLLAAAVTASGLRRTREYTAMRAVGLGPWRVAGPVLLVAAVAAAALTVFDDAVVVGASARADEIMAKRFQRGGMGRWQEPKRWFRGRDGRRVYHLRGTGEGGAYERVTVLELTPDFRLERRIDAARMGPGPSGAWTLEGVEERTFAPDGSLRLERHEQKAYRFEEDPEAFSVRPGWPAQMRRAVLDEQVGVRRRLGLPTADYELELARKIAYPAAAIPAALLALALALRRDRRGYLTASLVESVAVSLAFWGLQGIAWSLGRSGRLPPTAAAWLPDAVLLGAGAWALRRFR